MTITITKQLDSTWGDLEALAEMPDAKLISFLLEDPIELLRDADWVIANPAKVTAAPISIVAPPVEAPKRRFGSLEAQLEEIATEKGLTPEPRKDYKKLLSLKAKAVGWDELIAEFETWCELQNNYHGRKPITSFLNGARPIASERSTVTSLNVEDVERRVALYTDNGAVFRNHQRLELNKLIVSHGKDLVVGAFEEFWTKACTDDYTKKWATNNFLQQAETYIATRVTQRDLAEKQKKLASATRQKMVADAERQRKALEAAQAAEEELEAEGL